MKHADKATQIRQMFESGMTPRLIGTTLGVTPGYIREILNRIRPGCVTAKLNERLAMARNGQDAEQIALRILKGEPLRKIARETGISFGAVWQIGRRNGMRKLTDIKRDRANRLAYLYDEMGMTQRELAAEFGMSQVGVSVAIRRARRPEASQ